MHIIEVLAGHDITKFDAVLKRPAYEAFVHMTYAEDKALEERTNKVLNG